MNGARPTNNGLRINGIDATNMLNAGGGLGNNVGIPLDALDQVDVQTALPSAARGRNGGGNIELITRSGTDRFSGSAGYYFQHEKLNANEFFLNRAGVEKPEFRRNDTTVDARRPRAPAPHVLLRVGTAPDVPVRLRLERECRDRAADRPDRRAERRHHRRGGQRMAAHRRCRTIRGSRANFMTALRAFPAEQQAGLIAKFFADPARPDVSRADARRHPSGRAQHPQPASATGSSSFRRRHAALPILRGNGTFGREYLLQQVIPTELEGFSGFRLAAASRWRVQPDAGDG